MPIGSQRWYRCPMDDDFKPELRPKTRLREADIFTRQSAQSASRNPLKARQCFRLNPQSAPRET
eukprot:9488151-Alexandrium_andersonii.AAC.1